ncbi:hypothetical protein GCM10009858_46560 [Terrabacter carboxydivorans]|uniref:Uncharacterized protein n=1 Tax=Terrabacter carboxydivorans TaxID=619730 RepID=A0ABN3MJC0_9MICO
MAQVVERATGRAVCLAFAQALAAFGVPEEVITATASGSLTGSAPTGHVAGRCCSIRSVAATGSGTG